MTAIQNYKILIETIYGEGTTTFDTSKNRTNNVIGALNNQTQYLEFKKNFTERLYRLKSIYTDNPEYLKEILKQINLIASTKNWEGAFAELSVFDHLNQDILGSKNFLNKPIEPNVTIDKIETFAYELGKKEANLDGFIESYGLYFDIKCLKDIVDEILQGIYKELKVYLETSNFNISAEYQLDISYSDFQERRNELLSELKESINQNEKTQYIKSSIIDSLSYRLIWGNGVSTTVSTYHPYRHAENYHKLIFNNADQFVKDKLSIIIYVSFPWYNGVIRSFSNSNIQFYRSFARRVFCQYRNDNTKFSSFNSKFSSELSMYEVSNYISGILFLEDDMILSKEPSNTNVKSYLYLNPNAKKTLKNSLVFDYLIRLNNIDFDDFEYDNY